METAEVLQNKPYSNFKDSVPESLLGILGFGLIGIVILTSLITVGSFSSNDVLVPEAISTSNVTNTSFTLAWKTNKASKGYVVFGTNPENLSVSAYDNKAPLKIGNQFQSQDHTVTLTNLKPATYYYYKIVSNEEEFEKIDNYFFEPVKTAVVSPFIEEKLRLPFN